VLANVNRAVAPGWSIWTDQQDSLSMRDTGWLQYYCADNQEVLDTVLLGFRIGEAVRLPVMVVLDAFVLSHTAEEVFIPPQELVDRLIPRFDPDVRLDPENPAIFGGLTVPELYPSFRRKIDRALARVPEVEAEAEAAFEDLFGTRYRAVTGYRVDDADLVLVASATPARTARATVDAMRDRGVRAGVVRVRRFRPFPASELRDVLRGRAKVAVLDRNVSLGGEGIFATEVKSALYGMPEAPPVFGFIAGLGGQDLTPSVIEEILETVRTKDRPDDEPTWIGVLPERRSATETEEVSA
jgi:pyruvate/2-oxoacid:ferredoxin oxidoreductase alpha subunit